ncbi:g6269 [Coccomyxa elongata]
MNLTVQLSNSSKDSDQSGSQYVSILSDGQTSEATPTPVAATTPLSRRRLQQETRQEGIARRLAEDFAKDCNELQDGFGASTTHVPAIAGSPPHMIHNPEFCEDSPSQSHHLSADTIPAAMCLAAMQALPMQQKALLWLGIVLDVSSKISLCVSLWRFAHRQRWLWFGATLGFFTLSSAVCVMYWMTHYPTATMDQELRESRSKFQRFDLQEARVHGLRKETFKAWVRRLGTLCAVLQLGTAFVATRALFSSEARQRLVEMDLRGMRLADTVFLTLGVCLLQVYIGMRCVHQTTSCMYHVHGGFDWITCASIVASLSSSALCFLSLEINDHRFIKDRSHQVELACFFMYRLAELSARVTLLALFANIYGFWTLLPLGVHAAAVLLLLRFSPGKGQRNIWRKATTATSAELPASVKLSLQRFDDVKLLVACMAWPPSVFVSDATDTQGRFWWRSRMCGRKSACDVAMKSRLVPFPAFNCLIAAEAACLLGLMWGTGVPAWAVRYLGVAVLLHILWGFLGMLWLACVHMCSMERQLDDLCRVAAQQECLHMKTLRALLPRSNARLLPVLREDAESSEACGAPDTSPCADVAESGYSGALVQATASREGSPVHALLSSIGIQIPTGEYQEGPQSCPVWRPSK